MAEQQQEPLTLEKGLSIALERIETCKNSKKQLILSLKNLNLNKIPKEVFEITGLRDLFVGNNPLSEIPQDITRLNKLKIFNAPKCNLTEFPKALLEMPNIHSINLTNNEISIIPENIDVLSNLKVLSLGGNQITELPEAITRLTNLSDLNLSNNKIRHLPENILDLTNLKSIILTKNPIKFLQTDKKSNLSGNNAVVQVLRYFMSTIKTNGRSNDGKFHSHIDFNKDFKTAFYQYLIFFNSFIEKTKGKNLDIEIQNDENGLTIIGNLEDKLIIIIYLEEFIGFIKEKLESIEPIFERTLSDNEKELAIIELRNQIRHLMSQLELKNLENRMLNGEVNRLMQIIGLEKSNPQPIYIHASSNSHSSAVTTTTVNFKIELPSFQKEFWELKNELDDNVSDSQRRELEIIDAELMAIDENSLAKDVNRSPFKRLERIFDQLNNPESTWSKAVSGTKKGVDLLQSLGRKYNKVAPWLAIPSIPDVLL